jgi:hypothetical protein
MEVNLELEDGRWSAWGSSGGGLVNLVTRVRTLVIEGQKCFQQISYQALKACRKADDI